MHSAFVFFGASADLFLSLMLWFIFDPENVPSLYIDGDKVYAIKNVVSTLHLTNTIEDCEIEE